MTEEGPMRKKEEDIQAFSRPFPPRIDHRIPGRQDGHAEDGVETGSGRRRNIFSLSAGRVRCEARNCLANGYMEDAQWMKRTI